MNIIRVFFGITSIVLGHFVHAQTVNGSPVANYSSCLSLEQTSFDKGCLASHRAQRFVTNRCDQSVNIEYRFSGSFVTQNSTTGSIRTEYNVKPGSRVRLFSCYTVENSGQIDIVSVKPYGSASSSSGGSSSATQSSNRGAVNQSGTLGSGSTPRQATSVEEIRQRQSAAQNRSSSGNNQRSAADVQRDQIQRQQQRQNSTTQSSSPQSSATQSSASSANSTNTQMQRAQRNHDLQRQQQSEISRREQQALANREHHEALAQLGAAAIFAHITLGYMIYNSLPDVYSSESTFRGNGVHHELNVGYGLSYYHMDIPNVSESPFMIDFGATYHMNLVQGNNFGVGLRSDLEVGHSLLFDTRFQWGWGGNVYLGHKNVRLFTELQYFDNSLWFAGSNIDNSALQEYSLRWRANRLSVGPLFSWNGNMNHLKILYQWDYYRLPNDSRNHSERGLYPIMNGYRIEYLKRNHLQFFAQYNNMIASPRRPPSAPIIDGIRRNDLPGSHTPSGALYSIGVRRTWDWHKSGSFDSSLKSISRHNFDDNNVYISLLNPIIEWGSLQRGEDQFLLDGPQLSFNLISAELQFGIAENIVGSLGIGLSSLRRISGAVNYAERTRPGPYTLYNPASDTYHPESFTPIDGNWGLFKRTDQLNRYSYLDLELPIGVQYFFPGTYRDRYWVAAKLSPVMTIGEMGEEMYFDGPLFNDFHMLYRLGFGVDLPSTLHQNLRWGVYYLLRSKTIDLENVTQNMHGVQFQMAIGI